MTELLRPALYDAWHEIVPVSRRRGPPQVYDVVGPVCETGDTFAVDRRLPPCEAGDLLMIRTTGAYGAAMASNYNSRPLAAEVMIDLVVTRWCGASDFRRNDRREQLARSWDST